MIGRRELELTFSEFFRAANGGCDVLDVGEEVGVSGDGVVS